MIEADIKYYERIGILNKKRQKVLFMEQKRCEAAVKWFETNKLTPETKPEFDKLMKYINNKY